MTFDAGRIRHDAVLMHYSRQSNGSAAGSNWNLRATGDTGLVWMPDAGGGSVSYGSNAMDVTSADNGGASTDVSRMDHRHRGVTTVSHSSNTYVGDITLQTEGGAYIVRPSANTFIIGATTGSSGGGGGGGGGTLTIEDPDASTTVAATKLVVPAGRLTVSGTVATLNVDPVYDLFGTPDTQYEFDTSSLSGLTAIGSPTTEDANTTIEGALFYKDSTSTTAYMGRYQASPSTPFTIMCLVIDAPLRINFNEVSLLIGVANPATGAFVVNSWGQGTRTISALKYTNRTTFGSTLATSSDHIQAPIWFGMVCNSTTSIDYYYSNNGYLWTKYLSANNPSLTVGSVGIAMKSENSTAFSAAFDYFRIWNSAKTFPGN